MAKIDLEKVLIALLNSPFNKQFDDKVKKALKEQGLEYKNGEIVESQKPKFHEGDWVIQERVGVYKVIEVCESWYEVVDSKDEHYSIGFDVEYMCHPWTIQDAKDGDVLMSRAPFIYGKQCPYGGLNWYNGKFIKASNYVFSDSPVHPATKEQRALLFQKMKEAGYEWDADKKELKKK